jgi:Winged helix-turn-helix DNA-binding
MGRKRETQPPVDAAFIRECFDIRDDGAIIRRSNGEPATFTGPKAVVLVRVRHNGRTRRVVALRVAWCLSTGQWPKGVVRSRDGDDHNFRSGNLIVVRRGKNPFAIGTSSLKRRAEVDRRMLEALAENPGLTLPQLSKLTGSSESCCCTRLGKLSDMGLTCGPKCDARARWDLTAQGRAIAAAPIAVILDDVDKNILMACARAAHGMMALVRETGSCRLTLRRRVDRLIERALVSQTDGRYAITDQGRAALGPDAPRPWVRPELVSAAAARDVLARGGSDLLTTAERGRMGGNATAWLRKTSLVDERIAS